MKWDSWVGPTNDGPPVMWIKNLVAIETRWGKFRIDIHKMVLPDWPGCHHTHPAYAIRFPFWGGYFEEYVDRGACFDVLEGWSSELVTRIRRVHRWIPTLIRPNFAHRIEALPNGPSYSLWFRGPVIRDVELVGPGWPQQDSGDRNEGFTNGKQ